MTEKRFYKNLSDIEDYRIYDKDKEDAYFVSCDDHTVDCLVELLNELHDENKELKELLWLISRAHSFTEEESVKEILRNEIRGLDTVSYEFAGAWHDYCILSKFFEKQYGEHWDNE